MKPFRRGVELLRRGDPTAALPCFQESLAAGIDDQKADSLYNIAVCRVQLGDVEAAVGAISQALGIDRALASQIRSDQDFAPLAANESFRLALSGDEGRGRTAVISPATPTAAAGPKVLFFGP